MDLALQGNTLHTKAPPTALLAKTCLFDMFKTSSQFNLNGRKTKLYKLTDLAFAMAAKTKHHWSIDDCVSFLLSWKPQEKMLTFFNQGINSKYFYFDYKKPNIQRYTTPTQGFN